MTNTTLFTYLSLKRIPTITNCKNLLIKDIGYNLNQRGFLAAQTLAPMKKFYTNKIGGYFWKLSSSFSDSCQFFFQNLWNTFIINIPQLDTVLYLNMRFYETLRHGLIGTELFNFSLSLQGSCRLLRHPLVHSPIRHYTEYS